MSKLTRLFITSHATIKMTMYSNRLTTFRLHGDPDVSGNKSLKVARYSNLLLYEGKNNIRLYGRLFIRIC